MTALVLVLGGLTALLALLEGASVPAAITLGIICSFFAAFCVWLTGEDDDWPKDV